MAYKLYHDDCLKWLDEQPENSFEAIITDPPYGLKEYQDFEELYTFFYQWGTKALRVVVPGAHLFIATNTFLSHILSIALTDAGWEKRGDVARLVQTLRGGDRPKNAEEEFSDVTVIPRSAWEPWGIFRKPIEGRVQDNLRKWKTGGLRRDSVERPFTDVIPDERTPQRERDIVAHPSLKPQLFMRKIVHASLPLGEGRILDPFMGGGSTIAAAENVGYTSVGVEIDRQYYEMARTAIPLLAALYSEDKIAISTETSNNLENCVLYYSQERLFTDV